MNQRKEFVLKAIETHNFRALCAEYGISTKTGYKWKARLLEHGLAGLTGLSQLDPVFRNFRCEIFGFPRKASGLVSKTPCSADLVSSPGLGSW